MAGKNRDLWYFVCKYGFSLLPETLFHNVVGWIMHRRFKVKYHWMNIKHPKTFSEKLQYLKKHPTSSDLSCLADKYDVREYVKNKIGESYLIPLEGKGIYNKAEDIDFKNLPSAFVLKLTKGSGYNIICRDKFRLNHNDTVNLLNKWLKVNPYYMSREKQYLGMPRIICERMLEYNITDYKFFCFNGQPRFVELVIDRLGNQQKVFFDMAWQKAPFTTANDNFDLDITKPTKFEELYNVASVLATGFSFVRVDLYVHNGRVYFGELTFYPAGGYTPITPRKWEYELGGMLEL